MPQNFRLLILATLGRSSHAFFSRSVQGIWYHYQERGEVASLQADHCTGGRGDEGERGQGWQEVWKEEGIKGA